MQIFKLYLITLLTLFSNASFANSWLWSMDVGAARPTFSNHLTKVWMNQLMENQYTVKFSNSNLLGIGLFYEWDYCQYALDLGARGYYIHHRISGVNSPFINWADDTDTLNYTALGNSYALIIEPKFVLTKQGLQPYLLAGAGIVFNRLYSYRETPSIIYSTAAPTLTPFISKTKLQPAFEAGLGLQYALPDIYKGLLIALDYRYMNLGNLSLGKALNTDSELLKFGSLSLNVINLAAIIRF